MSLKKFSPNDIITNTMKAHPKSEFFIYNSNVYYNNIPAMSGAFTGSTFIDSDTRPDLQGTILCTSGTRWSGGSGFISLYEYNIDRSSGQGMHDTGHTPVSKLGNHFIYPFITKDTAGAAFRSVLTSSDAENEWQFAEMGDVLVGKYPMSATITREYSSEPGERPFMYNTSSGAQEFYTDADGVSQPLYAEPVHRHFWALKNTLDRNVNDSPYFAVTSSFSSSRGPVGWDKSTQPTSLISIPSIFYGSRIKPGSVSLKMYYTGTLIGELKDYKMNGELIQTTGTYEQAIVNPNEGSGSIGGVVLYNQGFLYLTGNWPLVNETVDFGHVAGAGRDYPRWRYFGAGAHDGTTASADQYSYSNMAFKMSFEGVSETQVVTMFARAGKGEANYSNNHTYIKKDQPRTRYTSSYAYEENPERKILNFASASQINQSASFKRQVYISQVGIYDEDHNLMGVATLSSPVLKKEDQDYTFKLKLDI